MVRTGQDYHVKNLSLFTCHKNYWISDKPDGKPPLLSTSRALEGKGDFKGKIIWFYMKVSMPSDP